MRHAATATHWTLYSLLAVTLGLGIANAWVRGDKLSGLFTIPQLAPGNQALKQLLESLHGSFANAIIIAASIHALAAVVHHFVLRDSVMRRMAPPLNRK